MHTLCMTHTVRIGSHFAYKHAGAYTYQYVANPITTVEDNVLIKFTQVHQAFKCLHAAAT